MKEKETYLFYEQWKHDKEILISRIADECSSNLPDNGTVTALRLIFNDKRKRAKKQRAIQELGETIPPSIAQSRPIYRAACQPCRRH